MKHVRHVPFVEGSTKTASLQVGTPSGHGSFTTAEVVFDKASSWGSQWFSRQVSRRLKMGVEVS